MVHLYRIDLPGSRGICTVWAESADDALRQDALGRRPGAQATDITAEHTGADNPYRAHALAVIAAGATGRAHLRLTSQRENTGWCFADGTIVGETDPEPAIVVAPEIYHPTALCA